MTKREGYSKRMERNLASWNERFEARVQEANRDGVTVKRETKEELESWKASSTAVAAKLDELRDAAARWMAIRGDLETAWQQIAGVLGSADPPPKSATKADRKPAVGSL